MKLVVVGATGFVATEVIRQALCLQQVTSIVSIARRSVIAPRDLGTGADASKLTNVVIEDLGSYPEDVRGALKDVDACIWTPSIGPLIAKSHTLEEVKRVNNEYPLLCLQTLRTLRDTPSSSNPLRFLFMSGYTAIRSSSPLFTPEPTLSFMDQWRQIRGHAETLLSAYAASTNGKVQVCSARPGIITEKGRVRIDVGKMPQMEEFVRLTPKVDVDVVAAALLDGVMHGFVEDPLKHKMIAEVGRKALEKRQNMGLYGK